MIKQSSLNMELIDCKDRNTFKPVYYVSFGGSHTSEFASGGRCLGLTI